MIRDASLGGVQTNNVGGFGESAPIQTEAYPLLTMGRRVVAIRQVVLSQRARCSDIARQEVPHQTHRRAAPLELAHLHEPVWHSFHHVQLVSARSD